MVHGVRPHPHDQNVGGPFVHQEGVAQRIALDATLADMLTIDVTVREFRNHTKQVVERIEDGTTMYLTKNGARIATIAPLRTPSWAEHVDRVLADGDGKAYDSGLTDLLRAADERSAAFDDDHLEPQP